MTEDQTTPIDIEAPAAPTSRSPGRPKSAPTPPKTKGVHTHVDWSAEWSAPDGLMPSAVRDVSFDEASRRLADVARAAVHHAVVSGEASVTLRVKRGRTRR